MVSKSVMKLYINIEKMEYTVSLESDKISKYQICISHLCSQFRKRSAGECSSGRKGCEKSHVGKFHFYSDAILREYSI